MFCSLISWSPVNVQVLFLLLYSLDAVAMGSLHSVGLGLLAEVPRVIWADGESCRLESVGREDTGTLGPSTRLVRYLSSSGHLSAISWPDLGRLCLCQTPR